MTLFHWVIAFWWYIFNKITINDGYTIDNKVFEKCEYPQSKNLR